MRRTLLCLGLFVGVTSGCGTNGPQVVKVTGTVRLHGKPVPHANIMFNPNKGRPSIGTSDDKGVYKLSYGADQEGALVGPCDVTVSLNAIVPKNIDEEIAMNNAKSKPRPEVAIPSKYSSLATTPLHVTVTGDGKSIDLDLEDQ